MDERAIFIRLDAGNGDSTEIRFIRVENDASYVDLKEEIENDELDKLMGHGFIFLAERNLPLSKKQERRFKVTDNEVVVRITDAISSQPSKRARVIIEELEEESNLQSDMVEVNQDDKADNDSSKVRSSSGPCESKMRAKLATKA